VLLAVGDRRAIPSTWRSPITWVGGGNISPNLLADDVNLASADPRDSPLWRSVGWRADRCSYATAALLCLGYPGDLPRGERLSLICWAILVSRASRPARSRSGAGASADRSKRRRVRAVAARLEDV
jgi:hypothetical protein